jgi:methyl-accepting chemotaxis protein
MAEPMEVVKEQLKQLADRAHEDRQLLRDVAQTLERTNRTLDRTVTRVDELEKREEGTVQSLDKLRSRFFNIGLVLLSLVGGYLLNVWGRGL